MKNQDVRTEITAAGFHLWQIADVLGITDSNFSRKLRHELPEPEKQRIRQIIKGLKTDEQT